MTTKDPDISVALSTRTEASSRYSADDSTPATVLAPDEPTEEELKTLRRVPGRLPWTAHTIAFVEMCERLSFCGTIAVFVNFIQQPLPEGSVTGAGFEGQSGALGMGQRPATAITTFDSLWVYLMPLIGGYMADAHWGRYKTIMVACGAAIIGHSLLIVTSIPPVIVKAQASLAILIVGIIIMGLGTGGFKACVGTLMAEQTVDPRPKIKILKNGERVIIDNDLTVTRSYMYFYLFLNVGAIVGETGMSEKYVGFWLAYVIPLFMFCICPIIMLWGRKSYVRSPPSGSVLSKAFKLWRLATKGQWSLNPVRTYKNLSNPDLWQRVKPSKIPADQRPLWMTFDDNWVDEVNRGLKACKVLSWYPLLWLGYNQMLHNLTSQAATLRTHGLPNDFYSNINPFTLIIIIPFFDQFLYPALRKAGVNFSPLKRITAGFAAATLALIWVAVLQVYIYRLGPCKNFPNGCGQVAPISAWWQTGPFSLIALSELLSVTTGMEYCFAKAPTNMRSLVYAIYLFMTAIAAAVGQAFVPLSDDPLLVWNYTVIAVILFFGTCGFWWSFRGLDRMEVDEARVPGATTIATTTTTEGGFSPGVRDPEK
ncbi:MFS peptide transporter [Wilcoxina mikolae CBS 423.85]|nr:MFS peptide transporter [Wilcoxina mikolae CBS 423.85]